ncbi:hypothetical protein FSP39_004415 [Pinctada imbricata]|uniref:Uncharacterized protein n=1 Tax=Pinctada imbricata TaxID=66713 RepID=A0AA89C444_PINIB|nr:hypothetical protein FSP39_004415 [Pinctada imbricata]
MESLLNCLSVSEIFQILTALLAGTYFGGMLYVTVIEAQSREHLPIVSHWEQWCSSFRRAGKLMPLMAILQAITSVGVYMSNIESRDQMIWLIPPGIMIFLILYTLIFMMKLNSSLLEKDVIKEKGLFLISSQSLKLV